MDREKFVQQVLAPVARVRTTKDRGSATIIHSTEDYGTWLLTNRHVVDANVTYREVWDELLRRNVKKEFTSMVEVDVYRVNCHGDVQGLMTADADIVISNAQQDLALLRLRDDTIYHTVRMYDEASCSQIPILSELACTGAAMGEKPIVTLGLLNGKQIEIDNHEYWLSSAQSIFGNSGGAVFAKTPDGWHYIGMPCRIKVAVMGFAADAITHMGYFIPLPRIYQWLRDNCYEFLWDPSVTKEDCDLRREQKRERELALAMIREK